MRYSNAFLKLFGQDLHCLQRFYHNVDHWCISLYHHANFVELSLVRYNNPCLRLFMIYIVYRDFITTLITILSYKILHLADLSDIGLCGPH